MKPRKYVYFSGTGHKGNVYKFSGPHFISIVKLMTLILVERAEGEAETTKQAEGNQAWS